MRNIILALVVTSPFTAASVNAGTRYVAPPATGGNDNNLGTSSAQFDN